MKKLNKKGFTIVELVIVIGVIGILSAILIPTFVNLTSEARKKELQANLRNAYTAYIAEAADGVLDVDGTTEIKIVGEADVYLSDKNTAAGAAAAKASYHYDGKEWVVNADALTVANLKFVVEGDDDASQFNGYYVYYLVA